MAPRFETLNDWAEKRPEIFKKRIPNFRGLDACVIGSNRGDPG
ncbi:hypothetical protein D779_1026 [Imhoffiella purpurea]|uniref:Uncharacterized protein n=1 Tax=Imhoffiella purpurea TaxID=1249627 RepID=W9VIB9_9GAMM|nr:hypothetical protein D779_1026 [Imhoffiella purpurea]